MNKKLLMIVDPQMDFIDGALCVSGARSAMDRLAQYIRNHGDRYVHIIVTADRHPFNHCSFAEYGGVWPRHCVHDTVGAAVWQPVMEALYDYGGRVTFLYKGEDPTAEQYSIFAVEEAAARIAAIMEAEGIGHIDLCGIAGDVCVASTLTDGIRLMGAGVFDVLLPFCPSLDGGRKLNECVNYLDTLCNR